MASVSAGLAGIQAEDLECPVCFSIPRATSSASPAGGRLRRVVSHVPRLLPPSSQQPSHHQHLRRAIDLQVPRAYIIYKCKFVGTYIFGSQMLPNYFHLKYCLHCVWTKKGKQKKISVLNVLDWFLIGSSIIFRLNICYVKLSMPLGSCSSLTFWIGKY